MTQRLLILARAIIDGTGAGDLICNLYDCYTMQDCYTK